MKCPHTMLVDDQAADVDAVGQATWGAVVAGGQDALVADDDGAHRGARAGAAPGDLEGDLHEIAIPRGAFDMRLHTTFSRIGLPMSPRLPKRGDIGSLITSGFRRRLFGRRIAVE